MIKDIWIGLRPVQWTKNVVLFAGLIFSQSFFDVWQFMMVAFGVLIFSLASSGLYLVNDCLDAAYDRRHPVKKNRPIAAGRLPVSMAMIIACLLFVLALTAGFYLNKRFFMVLFLYFCIGCGYAVYFKNIVIVDVFSIASGFLLRVLAGAAVIQAPVSSWLLTCTIFLSLFLALGKRRSEIRLLKEGAIHHRAVLSEYSVLFLDQLITIVTASAILSYVLYVFSPETIAKFSTHHLQLTIPCVVYGVFRYLYLIYLKEKGGAPERVLFTDRPFLINLGLYGFIVLMVLYR